MYKVNLKVRSWSSVLHVAISSLACPRLEATAILLPILPPGMDVVQLVADFK